MKPHPRITKTVKWGGAVVTVLLVVVYVASFACPFRVYSQTPALGLTAEVGHGCVHVLWNVNWGGAPRTNWTWLRVPPIAQWRPSAQLVWIMGQITIPFWIPLAMGCAITALAWRSDTLARRRAVGLCPKCNYDRAGLAVGAVCPECGARGTDALL